MRLHVDDTKQANVEEYLKTYSYNFESLCKQIDQFGIVEKFSRRDACIEAFGEGKYTGSPGKDIFFALPYMSDSHVDCLAEQLACKFPQHPPYDHVAFAACIRYIYGCFDKQGTLLSDRHKNIIALMKWDRCDLFMDRVYYFLKKHNRYYGQVIYNEMKGHRLGDLINTTNDISLKNSMLEVYCKSQAIAVSINSCKHTFTPFYWAARYLESISAEEAVTYHWKNLRNMERFCPDGRAGYKTKALDSISFICEHGEKDRLIRWLKQCKNTCLVRVQKSKPFRKIVNRCQS